MKPADNQPLGYRAVLSGKEGAYVFHIRELGLMGSGPDIPAAYEALQKKQKAVFDEFAAAGLTDELPAPETEPTVKSTAAAYKGIAIKTAVVTLGALIVVAGLTMSARSVITAGVDAVKIKPGEIHLKLLEDKIIATLNTAADPRNEYSAEKREKLIQSLRTLVERYKPYVDEIRPLLSGDEAANTPSPAKQN